MRDYKIVQMWLGGAHRDRLDIAQGLYGPFKWGGFEEWEQKQKLGELRIKVRDCAIGSPSKQEGNSCGNKSTIS